MFNRITYEDWHTIAPIVAFILTFAVFAYFIVRAFQMRKPHLEHMSRLPLDD